MSEDWTAKDRALFASKTPLTTAELKRIAEIRRRIHAGDWSSLSRGGELLVFRFAELQGTTAPALLWRWHATDTDDAEEVTQDDKKPGAGACKSCGGSGRLAGDLCLRCAGSGKEPVDDDDDDEPGDDGGDTKVKQLMRRMFR